MLGKKSAFLAIYLIACIVISTSPASARSRHQRHQGRGEGRPKGRYHNDNNNNNRQGYNHHTDTNQSSPFNEEQEDDGLGYHYQQQDTVDGITVPSLHSMQMYGLTSSGERKERRPIRGSRKAVVVTKKTYLKKEWCKTQPLKQIVRMRGCLRTKILNNFCYGQCNSFFIPKKARRDKNAEAFLSCGFCRPRRFRWILVTLRCPGKNGMRFKRKRVQFIKKCRCMAQEVTMGPMS